MHVYPDFLIALAVAAACLLAGILTGRTARRLYDRRAMRAEQESWASSAQPDARLIRSPNYWSGLAAGARYVGRWHDDAEIVEFYELPMQPDASQAEHDFALGWQASVETRYQQAKHRLSHAEPVLYRVIER